MSDKLFYLLQVNDALFPIGAYSHSQGLETYIQKGIVKDEKTAEEYILNKIRWNLAHSELLAVKLSCEYAKERNLAGILKVEEILEASRLPEEQREASRKMGSRFVKTIDKLDLDITVSGIFAEYVENRRGNVMNHCCAYGVFCGALEMELDEVLAHYLYNQTSAIVTNCVKTIPLSQTAGQKLLAGCYDSFKTILREVKAWTEDDLCISAPGFDIRGMQHEKLYSRIYMS